MTAYRELIERLEQRGQEFSDQSDRFLSMGMKSIVSETRKGMALLREAAFALRALEAQSKDKEEAE